MSDTTPANLASAQPEKKRKSKIIVIILATIILLPVIVVVSIPLFFNANDFKSQLSTFVHEQTGRDLTISGEVSVSFFPWLGLEVGAITLSNAPEFGTEPFARIASADLKIKLEPLLFEQKFELDIISLSGLQLYLSKNKQGQFNWNDLAAADSENNTADESSFNFENLAINGLNIHRAQVVWRDDMLDAQYEISNLSISTGVLAWRQPVDFHLAAALAMNDPAMTGKIELQTRLKYNVPTQRYNLNIEQLQAQLNGTMFPHHHADFHLSGHIDIDAEQQKIKVQQINIKSNNLDVLNNLKGELELIDSSLPHVTFSFSVDQLDLDQFTTPSNTVAESPTDKPSTITISQILPHLPEETMSKLELQGELTVNALRAAGLVLNKNVLKIEAKSGKISLRQQALVGEQGEMKNVANLIVKDKQTKLDATINLSAINLQPLLAANNMPNDTKKSLRLLDMALKLTATEDKLDLSEINVKLDESTLTGHLALLAGAIPDLQFDLFLDEINIDDYFPQENNKVPTQAKQTKQADNTDFIPRLPEFLQTLSLSSRLRIDRLNVADIRLKKTDIKLEAKNNELSLKKLQTTIDDSTELNAVLTLSEAKKTPQLNGKVTILGLNAREIMSKLGRALPPTEKEDTFKDVDIKLDLNISNNKIKLSNMLVGVDQAGLSGDLAVQLNGMDIPNIVADLTVDYLRVDDYFLTESSVEKQQKPEPDASSAQQNVPILMTILPNLPVEEWQKLDMDVKLKLKKSSVLGLSFENSELTLQAEQGDIQLACLDVEPAETQLSCNIKIDARGAAPKGSAKLKVLGLNLRKLMKQVGVVPPETSNPNTFERFDIATEFSVDASDLEFKKLLLRLDDATLKGLLTVHAGEQPVIDAKLMVDRFNLDDYLAPESAADSEPSKKNRPAAQNEESLPLDDLRRLKIDLAIRIDELQAYKLKLGKVKVDLVGKKGLFRVYPLQGNLYGGIYEGKLFADFRNGQAKYTMDDQLKNIQLGPLFDDLDELDRIEKRKGKKSTTGTISANWQLVFQGENAQGLNGQAKFEVRDGATYKVSLKKLILNSIKDSLTGQKRSKQNDINSTEFERVSGSIKINNGMIQNDDFLLESGALEAKGAGKIDLVASQVNYVVKTNIRQGQGLLKMVEGRYISIKIKGSLDNLSYYPDIGGELSSAAGKLKESSKQLGTNVKNVVGGSLKGVGKGIKNVFQPKAE